MMHYRRALALLSSSRKILSKRNYLSNFHRILYSDRKRFSFIPFLCALGGSYVISNQYLAEADAADEKKHLAFSRYMVADAVSLVSPCVVNILCPIEGLIASGMSSGSGFILSKDGFVVTNAHVVAPSTNGNVIVTLWDTRKFYGKVHSMDRLSDIALIKIEASVGEDLPIATLGRSNKLKAGEFVVALGSPLFLQNSVSFGIVSATARHGSEIGMEKNRTDFIQTDAAINIGNSGGPLVNLDGEVIGINSMKAQGVDGISFAIPIDTASIIINQLMKNKRVVRPYIGLRMADFVPDSRDRFPSLRRGRGGGGGAAGAIPGRYAEEGSIPMVVDVSYGSPAQAAGFKSGDIILDIDGKKVSSVREVLESIGLDIGRRIVFRVKRQDGKEVTLAVTTAPEELR